jgi:hypothetical protein
MKLVIQREPSVVRSELLACEVPVLALVDGREWERREPALHEDESGAKVFGVFVEAQDFEGPADLDGETFLRMLLERGALEAFPLEQPDEVRVTLFMRQPFAVRDAITHGRYGACIHLEAR